MSAMHNIQRKILEKLLYAETLPYARMRPERVESNHFAYHLDQLLRAHLVCKNEKLYTLTPQGLALVDRLSQEKMVERTQPHIVTVIDITNDHGQTLLYKKNFQPFIHRIGYPKGKLHADETVLQAANRELLEKTGLDAIPLTHRGIMYVEARREGFTISKILCHLFTGMSNNQSVQVNLKRGESFWGDPNSYNDIELMPAFKRMKYLLETEKQFFFSEETVDV